MKQNTITTAKNLQPGDLFTPVNGGYIYIVHSLEVFIKNCHLYTHTYRRIDRPATPENIKRLKPGTDVIFLKHHKTETPC